MDCSVRSLVVGLAFTSALLSIGCGGAAKPAPGMGCALNSDCAAGLICTFGFCHSACRVNGDCPSGTLCIETSVTGDGGGTNVCQLPVETKCVYNSDCKLPLVCARDEQCRNQCEANVDCVSPQVCTASKVCALMSQLTPGTNDVPVVTTGLDGGSTGGAGGASGAAGAGTGGNTGAGGAKGGGGGGGGTGTGGSGQPVVDAGFVEGDPCGPPGDAGTYGPESVANNDRGHATQLAVGEQYGACIQTPTDVDWYTFTAPSVGQGGYLTVALTNVDQTTVLKADLYAASTNGLIYTNTAPNLGSSLYTWIAVTPGVPLNFAVYGQFMDSRAVGAYTISTSFQAAVEPTEPNNSRAQATPVTLGTPVQGLFFRGYIDDVTMSDPSDYYKVTLATAGSVAASVTDISSNLRGDLVLYDSSGGQLMTATSASNSFGADADLTYSVSTAGTYYLLVTEEFPGEVPLVGSGRTLPDIATHPYTLTVTSP